MAPRSSRARSSGFVVLAVCGIALVRFGSQAPAYTVTGSWQGEPGALKNVVNGDFSTFGDGLEPTVKFPDMLYGRDGLSLSVEDGRLNADYSKSLDDDSQLKFRVNDKQAWKANFLGRDASLNVRGQGLDLDSLKWAASKQSNKSHLRDVKVDFNSDKEYNFTVGRRSLAKIAGADIEGEARATRGGVTSRLGARRVFPGGVEASYGVENPVGVYELGRSMHRGKVMGSVGGGNAVLEGNGDALQQSYKASYERDTLGGHARVSIASEDGALGYDVSYARRLDDVIPVSGDFHVGVDEHSVYGKANAKRDLGRGISADYAANARIGLDDEDSIKLDHALQLSNKFGYAKLSHQNGDVPRLRVGYDIDV
eukprot:TRINITY_DN58219_c0_g1_i1.p1 TRINITY_DN58219_c0_g1~~TRINITY_DN58219_c0_g1_i1.p1  ORF type:complete len:393 (+),score=44.63 TRINITY_DN58219_c0_g1_i1:78-1181(+)